MKPHVCSATSRTGTPDPQDIAMVRRQAVGNTLTFDGDGVASMGGFSSETAYRLTAGSRVD